MQVTELAIPGGPKLIVPRRFSDVRGWFTETYSRKAWSELAGIDMDFVQDNQSLSKAVGTVRALHYQLPPRAQAKLVRCTRGRMLDVAVDIRRGSPTFGHHVAVELTAEGGEQLFVPVGFAHGFSTLTQDTEVAYKVSDYYSPQHERGIRFDDPALEINWGIDLAAAVVNERDRKHPTLAEATELL